MIYRMIFILIVPALFSACAERRNSMLVNETADSLITLGNQEFSMSVKRRGGAYVDFHLIEKPLNPFGWRLLPEQMPANNKPYSFEGHFLCVGRWGAPSFGEINVGIPHNGEVNTVSWQVSPESVLVGFKVFEMSCTTPIEKLDAKREILIPEQGSYFIVKEHFTNNLPIGRVSNIVQHGTISAPFLTENTVINTNATRGFDQRTGYKYLEDSSFVWPIGFMADGSRLDLSRVDSDKAFVTSHIIEDSIGWITALNPEKNIIMGYIWKSSEYPWLNVWHQPLDGHPYVQGLEFGTTGLGQPYELLLENNVTFFGRHSFEYIDAGETIEKTWLCFQALVPDDFVQVISVTVANDKITIADEGDIVELQGHFY